MYKTYSEQLGVERQFQNTLKELRSYVQFEHISFQVFISGSWSRVQNSSKSENQAFSLYGFIFRFNWEMQNWTAHNIPSFAHSSAQHTRIHLWNHRKQNHCLKMHVLNCTQAMVLIKDQLRLLKVTVIQTCTVWFLMLLLKLGTCLYKNLHLPLAVCIPSPVKQQHFSLSS